MIRIVVTGAGGTAGRNFVRALRMGPDRVHVVGTDTNELQLQTGSTDARYLLPPSHHPAYAERLLEVVRRERAQLVHPQSDAGVAALSRHRDLLENRLFLPAAATIARCQDKLTSSRVLALAGVPAPPSAAFRAHEADRLFDGFSEGTDRAWVRARRGAGSLAALPVSSARQAADWVRYWVENRGQSEDDFVLSPYLPGAEFAFQSVWKDGRLITSMASERVEYLFGAHRPSGQSSTSSVARTVHRSDVNDTAYRAVLAAAERPHGVFCVDLKEDHRGVPCVTEINAGRFFTTSDFFAEAGSNMPWLYTRLALSLSIPPQPVFDAVAEGLWWVRGVDRAPSLVRRDKGTVSLARAS